MTNASDSLRYMEYKKTDLTEVVSGIVASRTGRIGMQETWENVVTDLQLR